MILVDSTVWIDYLNGKNTVKVNLLEKYLDSEIIIIGEVDSSIKCNVFDT